MLSTKADVKLEIHMMQRIKNRSWLLQAGLMGPAGGAAAAAKDVKDSAAETEVMLKKERRLKRLRGKEEEKAGADGSSMSSYRKRMKKRLEQEAAAGKGQLKKFRKSGSGLARRKSLSVHHHLDDGTPAMRDLGRRQMRLGGICWVVVVDHSDHRLNLVTLGQLQIRLERHSIGAGIYRVHGGRSGTCR